MSTIIGTGTSVPAHKFDQRQVRDVVRQLFDGSIFKVDRMLSVFSHTRVEERYFAMEADWYRKSRAFAEKNAIFQKVGIALARSAVEKACRAAAIAPAEIDHIFFVSTTGLATPSIDAHLLNRVPFKASILRTPIWGLGCGGGVAGIARAADWLKAYPDKIALVVALELCSLTFVRNDLSKSNFIATALFGDGCGAIILAGDERGEVQGSSRMLSIEATGSVTWPDTLDVMGWDIAEEGLKVVFSKDIPHIVETSSLPAIVRFLDQAGASLADIRHFLSHPGGAKVIDAYREALNLEERQITSMQAVLAKFGNMSSATILFVLDHFLRTADGRPGELVLSTALGPGFSSEMVLSRCS